MKMVLTQHFSYSLLWLVKGRQAQPKPNSTVVDWLDSLIVPGGLLLVAAVSQLFGIPILVLWVELETTETWM